MMVKVDNEIKGRLALITGASGGIGAACARDLWGEGASLALTYFQNRQSVDVLVEELTKSDATGRIITVHRVDTGSPDAIAQLFDEIKAQHGQAGPDILISNAGYGKRLPGILDVSLQEFDHTININLRASFILTKLSIPHMEARGWGRIIFISSIAAIGGGINACQYAASKAGLSGMMKNLAMKHARSRITVNDVAPAMIGDTGMIPDEKFVEGPAICFTCRSESPPTGKLRNQRLAHSGKPSQPCTTTTTSSSSNSDSSGKEEARMGTPFIALQEPTKLDGYDRTRPHDQQPAHVPKVFCDAMEVREAVFVREQGVPLENELDADDPRSCHWVMYASVNQTTEPEQRDEATGEVVRPRRSETRSQPIGTLRVVPFPHPPHPQDGGWYVGNVLREPPPQSAPAAAGGEGQGGAGAGADGQAAAPKAPALTKSHSSAADEERQNSALPFGTDRATTYHDGREPYVKVGRMAVIPEFRGHKIASQIWRAARKWLEEHPAYFNPSVTELGMDQLKAGASSEIPKWNGLVICHAQESVTKVYEQWGFKLDEGMGKWYEEGIPHVGMAVRLKIKDKNPTV
ncbi:hypothetical protein DL771_012362 [Monosporascus sp. 5C6A]|nr:hypothetical protein DL771_012362 [Monosporascus sp. 5C6A]